MLNGRLKEMFGFTWNDLNFCPSQGKIFNFVVDEDGN